MKNIRLIALIAIVAIAGSAPAFATSPDQDLKQAEGLIFKKQYREAIAVIDKAINLCPGLERAYFNRGVAYCHLKQYQNAVDDFNKAIELDPGHAESYASLVFALSRLEQSRRAGTTAVTGNNE